MTGKKQNGRNGRNGDGRKAKTNKLETQVHKITRFWDFGNMPKLAADAGTGFEFALQDLPNASDFTNLFERYRIDSVDIMFSLQNVPASSTFLYPILLSTIDYNDATNPTTENQVLERGNMEFEAFTPFKSVIRRTIKNPRVLADTSAGSISAEMPINTFLDTSSPGIAYYGLKVWVQNFNTAGVSNTQIRVYMKYHMSFKNAR